MNPIQPLKDVARPVRNRVLTNAMLRRLRSHQEQYARSAILIATPMHGNLGDQAIVFAQREFLADNFPDFDIFEIHRYQYELSREKIVELVRPGDLIVIDGGGNVGTLWPEENDKMNDIVRRFAGSPVVVFPQTAFFADTEEGHECEDRTAEAYASNPRLVFFSRDKATYDRINAMNVVDENLFVPDIVLYHDETSRLKRAGALLCLRDDKERSTPEGALSFLCDVLEARGFPVSETSTLVSLPKRIGEGNRNGVLASKWAEFGSAEVVVTDRLHGMIFSAITGTPCVALDNVSRKVSQGYEWIKDVENIRVASCLNEVPALLDDVLTIGSCSYDRSPRMPYYKKMKEPIERALI